MKQTDNFMLNLMEATDPVSARPLNENAEKIDAALLAQQIAAAGKAMVAAGSYTGDGTREVTLATPGFTPKVILMRTREKVTSGKYGKTTSAVSVEGGWCLWIGEDIEATYYISAKSIVNGEIEELHVTDKIQFTAEVGGVSWHLSPINFSEIYEDEGPTVMNNKKNVTYEWVAFGTTN